MSRLFKILTRKKALDPVSVEKTQLNRVLNTFDLTALGVGSTLGVGVYVLTGQVAKDIAGPSVILSFLIAAVASVFAALCYAEFGARAPRAGSAYIYSYVCVGELVAFCIGWNLILEYVIGSASVARGLSGYLDSLINNTLQETFLHIAPIKVNYMSAYFDFFAFGISVLLAVALAIGVKESSMINNIVTVLNVGVVLFVIIAGSLKANVSNWEVQPNATNSINSTDNIGEGGFFPFGIEGMIKGAAKCFYAFIGFDAIATTGEEVRNPKRAIPISILTSLLISFCAYFGTSTVLTLMVPYYLQDRSAPLTVAFEEVGWSWAKWVVAVGAIFGLCASLFGAMFPLPRIIFAMGSDGLIFKFLAKVHSRFKTPFVGTILAGLLTGLMAALFELEHLVNMMSIGTLLAYTIVAASVLLLRYAEEKKPIYCSVKTTSDSDSESVASSDGSESEKYSNDYGKRNIEGINSEDQNLVDDEPVVGHTFLHIFNCYRGKVSNKVSEKIVATEVLIYCVLCVFIGLSGRFLVKDMRNGEVWAISTASVFVGLAVILVIMILMQPTSKKELSFRVPLVPLIPALSILINIYLMMMLDSATWIRFGVWMVVGIPMYMCCVCDCVRKRKPPSTELIKNIVSDSTSSTLKLSSGLSNPVFVSDTNGFVVPTKKGKAPLPPSLSPASEKSENIEIQQQAVIAQLDEILDKEEDVLEKQTVRLNEQRLSDGTVSNLSAIVSRIEDVVADVHRDNVLATPPADPKHKPLSTYIGILKENPKFDTIEPQQVSKEAAEINDANVLFSKNIKINPPSPMIDQEIALPPPQIPLLEKHNPRVSCENLSDVHVSEEQEKEDDVFCFNSVDINDVPRVDLDFEIHSKNAINENKQLENISTSIEPPNEIIEKKVDAKFYSKPSFDEFPSTPLSPSVAALKSVNLRKTQKEIIDLERDLQESTALETNLRVGSQEYQEFRNNLNNKLKRMTVIPSYVSLPNKDVIIVPQKMEVNENVIEDHIDKNDAMSKIKIFLESQAESEKESKPKDTESEKKFLKNEDRSKSVDESMLASTYPNLKIPNKLNKVEEIVENFEKTVEESKEDITEFDEHKRKMKNIFDSINLRKTDPADSDNVRRKLSKSLGSSFLKEDDEKSMHRRKMDNIFGSINALRRSSGSLASNEGKIE